MTNIHLTSANFFKADPKEVVATAPFQKVPDNNYYYIEIKKFPLTSVPYTHCALSSGECICFENEAEAAKFHKAVDVCHRQYRQDPARDQYEQEGIRKEETKDVTRISFDGQDYFIAIPLKDLNKMINEAVKNNVASLDLDTYFTKAAPASINKNKLGGKKPGMGS